MRESGGRAFVRQAAFVCLSIAARTYDRYARSQRVKPPIEVTRGNAGLDGGCVASFALQDSGDFAPVAR